MMKDLQAYVKYYVKKLNGADRKNAYRSLLESDDEAIPFLIEAFEVEPNPEVRRILVGIIRQYRSRDTLDFFMELLNGDDAELWRGALDGLAAIEDDQVINVLEKMIQREGASAKGKWIDEALGQSQRFALQCVSSMVHEIGGSVRPLYGFLRLFERENTTIVPGELVLRVRVAYDKLYGILKKAREVYLQSDELGAITMLRIHRELFAELKITAQDLYQLAEVATQTSCVAEDAYIQEAAGKIMRNIPELFMLPPEYFSADTGK